MFREMRRKGQSIEKKEIEAILGRNTAGTIAVNGDDGYPYAVPMSYMYDEGQIYLHSAVSGHKVDAIKRDNRVSFSVIDQDKVVPEEFTTLFSSVIAFGRARVIDDRDEKLRTIRILTEKYSPNMKAKMEAEISDTFDRFIMIAIEVEHMTGKKSKRLM